MAIGFRAFATTTLYFVALVGMFSPQIASSQMPGRIGSGKSGRVDDDRVVLRGQMPSWATSDADLGPVDGTEKVQHLTLYFSRSSEREAAFQHLLLTQQAPGDPAYHSWYTPSELGRQFGVSDDQIQAVTAWLETYGLHVLTVSNSKTFLEFSGTVANLSSAFTVDFHWFRGNGANRWSITNDPKIPKGLASTIRSISGLSTETAHTTLKQGPSGSSAYSNCSGNNNCSSYFITPNDFATIYNISPLYAKGTTGTGRVIDIIGEARVDPADVAAFAAITNVNVPAPTVVIPTNGIDPGAPITSPPATPCANNSTDPTCILLDLQGEATLDVERAGSVAPGASVQLVVSTNTGGDPGILVATQYAVDSTNAPDIITISFSYCESPSSAASANQWNGIFEQAAAEGISVFVSSGDSDATCREGKFATPTPGDQFLSVNYLCSSSSVTCVGGTEFNDRGNYSTYWGSNGTGLGSALSYILEGAWNDPVQTDSSGNTVYEVEGSGGGFSQLLPAPPWQTNIAPFLGRALPDVAFSSSCHDAYLTCMESNGSGDSCVKNSSGDFRFKGSCGTSAAAPSMAGIMALVDQANSGRQGNANPALYALASNPSNHVFHDTAVASSGVGDCTIDSASMCNNTSPSASGLTGGTLGYLLQPGFDEVTGWGSIDVQNLIANWKPASSIAANPSTISISAPGWAGSTILSIIGFPTGNVMLTCTNLPQHSQCDFGKIAPDNTVTLSIATTSARKDDNGPIGQYPPLSVCLLVFCVFHRSDRYRRIRLVQVVICSVALLGLIALVGCGTKKVTPAGNTTITVTASTGSISASTQIQLMIQ